MKKFIIILFLCIFSFTGNVFANVSDNLYQYKLKNGQTVIIKEVKNNPVVIIDTFINAGSAKENDKNNGVAHFLEHLFFKGTTNHKRGEFEKALESKGGVFNAATSRDYTHYYVKIDSKYFDEALNLHADMLLNIAVPTNELDMERKVVMEEITRSVDNPENKVFDNFMKIVFDGEPYSRKILGTNQIIGNIKRDEILAFHDTFYTPKNIVTVVVGDVSAKQVLPKISKEFDFSCPAKTETSVTPQNPQKSNIKSKTIIERANVESGYLVMGYPTIGNKNLKEAYALSMAASVLANGQNSILYKKLKEDNNLILSVSGGNYALKNNGVFYVDAVFEPQNYEKILPIIKQEIQKLKTDLIPEKEITKIKNSEKRDFEYQNESISGIANAIGYDVAVGNGLSDYTNYLSVIDSISPEFIKETLNKYIKEENFALSVLLPKTPAKTAITKKIKNISYKNNSKAKLVSSYKNIKKYTLSNGATLILQKNSSNNVVATKIFIKGGSLAENKAGTASILSDTITMGTKNKTAKELADAMDNIGSSISVSDDFEFFEISMKTTKDDFNDAFSLLKEIIEEPAFAEKDINNTKKDILNAITASRDNPKHIAFDNFYNGLYENSPFLKTDKILEKSVPTITVNDVKKLYGELFSAKNMVISISGNFDEDEVIKNFSALKNSESFKPVSDELLKAKFSEKQNNIIKKENNNSKGAWLVQGWQTKGLSTNDFAALKVISTYLGGGFTSKLFVNLRENQGLAYEVGAVSSSNFNSGEFFMYIGTNPQNINTVKIAFNKEIEDLKTKPISEKELDEIKNMLIGRLKLAQETNMAKAYINGYYEFFDKGYQFGYHYSEMIQCVTSQDIMKTANKYFSSPYIMSIVAGDKYTK